MKEKPAAIIVTVIGVVLAGFVLYRIFMGIDTALENTFPIMIATSLLCIAVSSLRKKGD